MAVLPPPPINDAPGSFVWLEWYRQLRNYISQSGSVPWSVIDFTNSDISSIQVRNHNNLQNMQGGTSGQYYHLTAAQAASLGAGPHNSLTSIQGGVADERYHLTDVQHSYISTKTFPDLKIGDVSGGNYTNIASDGSISFLGTASGWEDLRIEPTIRSPGTNDPTYTQWFTDGAGSRGVYLYDFTDVITASQKEIFFTIQMPHSWKGTAITPHVHWIPKVAGTAQRPVWGMEYSWADTGTSFGNTNIVYTTSLIPNDVNLVINRHYKSFFDAITPSTSQDGISSILIGRIFRRSGDASDTYTGTCGLLSIDFHYEIDTIGSATVNAK